MPKQHHTQAKFRERRRSVSGRPRREDAGDDQHWIWGRHPVFEAVRAGQVTKIVLADSAHDTASVRMLQDEALKAGVRIERSPDAAVEAIAGPERRAQGIVALLREPKVIGVDELIDAATDSNRKPLLLVLDQIQDPHNLGALLRSAEAAGVDGVILTQRRSAPLSGTAVKSSAGAVFHLQLAHAGNLSDALRKLNRRGIWTIGLSEEGKMSIYEIDMAMPSAIIVGGEGHGLRNLTSHRVDTTARIPMSGRVGSLNASVAGAIALFEANRQRLTSLLEGNVSL